MIPGPGVRAAERLTGRSFLDLDYPPSASSDPRWGHGRRGNPALAERLAAGRGRYARALRVLDGFTEDLRNVPTADWRGGWFSGLDAIALYGFLRSRGARSYIEVGGGASTRFADHARRQGDLDLHITTIDPEPRVHIGSEARSDRALTAPLETIDLGLFAQLTAGDVVLLDGSHRAFMNSDVATFVCDVMPALPAGVLVGVHDIYLPDDYPPRLASCHWSEQYVLAALLLGGERWRVELPAWYVSRYTDLIRRAGAGILADEEPYADPGDSTCLWIERPVGEPSRRSG